MNNHGIKQNIFNDVEYWHNAIVHWIVIATLFINVGVFVLFAFYVHPSDFPLRLQYNVFFGTSLHTVWWHAYLLPMMGMVFSLIDLAIGYVLYSTKERVAGYLILLGGLFANVALFIAALSIIFNNYF
ncbi:MAG: hypothetical protein CR972_00455 [Candidatus Moraniibacteriota bacterium]|nr:MAG: hypothetical protein CR972_00455 [Candidatus Moranbacteria bacterium]